MSPSRFVWLGLAVALVLPLPARAQEGEPTPFWMPTEPETKPKQREHKKGKKRPVADDDEARKPEVKRRAAKKPQRPPKRARTETPEPVNEKPRDEPVRPRSKYEPLPPIPTIDPDEPQREPVRPVAPRLDPGKVRSPKDLRPIEIDEGTAPGQPTRNEYAPRPLDYTPRDAPPREPPPPRDAPPREPPPPRDAPPRDVPPQAPWLPMQPSRPLSTPFSSEPVPEVVQPIDERPARHRALSVQLLGGYWAKARADSTGRDFRFAYGLDLAYAPFRTLLIDLRALRCGTTSGNGFASTSDTHTLVGARVHYVFTKGLLSLLAGMGGGIDITQTTYALEPPGGTPQTLGANALKLAAEGALGVRVQPFGGLQASLEVTGVLRDGNFEPVLSLGVGWAF